MAEGICGLVIDIDSYYLEGGREITEGKYCLNYAPKGASNMSTVKPIEDQ